MTRLWGPLTAATCLALAHRASAQPIGAGEPSPPAPTAAVSGEAPRPQGATTTAAAIAPPELVRFTSAAYPPAAKAAGLQGNVGLTLTIGADGAVRAAEVVSSAGPEFDEAAVAAVQQFLFLPALRGGVPVASKIAYTYSFQLDEQGDEQRSEPLAASTSGELRGRVLMAGLDGGLAGALLRVRSPSGQPLSALTAVDGSWALTALEPGAYQVTVEAPGFQALTATESVVLGQATEVVYRIAATGDGLEVSITGSRPPREVTRRQITRRELTAVPGSGGDALRALQSLPGLARPPGLAGLLIVRGAAPQDTAVFIDGDTVPLIYHFGGLSSAVPTELLDRIDFYPGNFSAKYGRVQGGIVDVALRQPNTVCSANGGERERCYHGLASVDLIDGRALLQGPIPGTKKWSFAVGGRRSWVDAWIGPVLEEAGASVTNAPVYHDLQVLADYAPSSKTRLSLRYLRSSDRLRLVVEDPAAQDPGALGGSLRFETGFDRWQGVLESELSESVTLKGLLSVGTDKAAFSLGRFAFDLEATPIQARSEFEWTGASWLTLRGGLDFVVAPFDALVRLPEPPRPGEPAAGPTSLRPLLETRNKDTAFRPSWYADAQLRLGPRLTVVPALRVDYARDSGDTDVAPRATLRYTLTPEGQALGRTTLKAGAGVYYQPPQFQETDPVFGTPGTGNNRATHYSVGVERQLTGNVNISAEGFYKDLTEQVTRQAGPDGSFRYGNLGTGYVVGAETLLKYDADERFFGWLAYTLSRSIRQDGPGSPEYLFQFDQTHILTVLGSYKFGHGWEVGARFRLVSGSLDTPPRSPPSPAAVFAADAAAYTPLPAAPFSERLPLFHQLDVRAEKRWTTDRYALSVFLDIWNAYNNAAQEAISYNFDYSQRTYQEGLPIIPSLGMKGEF